jgi:hypothetical protein
VEIKKKRKKENFRNTEYLFPYVCADNSAVKIREEACSSRARERERERERERVRECVRKCRRQRGTQRQRVGDKERKKRANKGIETWSAIRSAHIHVVPACVQLL